MERVFAAIARRRAFLRSWPLQYVDLLVVPFVLEAQAVPVYLFARLLSLLVPLSLWLPTRRVRPHLESLAQPEPGEDFQSVAARVNLGFMMIAAAVSLAVFGAASYAVRQTGLDAGLHRDILLWLLLGQCGTVFFGATRLMMQAVGRGVFLKLLEGIAAICFGAALVLGSRDDPVFVAQAITAARLTQAALSALLLTQCGVWPGLSALLQPRIRLR